MEKFLGDIFEKIGKKLEETIERKEKLPKIRYHFYFSCHRTAEDVEGLENAFQKADVYFPAAFGWTEEYRKTMLDLSGGKITTEELAKRCEDLTPARRREFEIIYNSRKPILFADIPAGDRKLIKAQEENEHLAWRAIGNFIKGNLEESFRTFRDFSTEYVKLNKKEEGKIKKNLDRQMKKFLKENPDYKNQDELTVLALVRLGVFHTKLYRDFKKEGKMVSRQIHPLPLVFAPMQETFRRMDSGQKCSDELIGQAIVGNLIMEKLRPLTDNGGKLLKITRELTSQLNLEKIGGISKNFSKDIAPDINKELRKLNIKVPESEEEIDEILGPQRQI